MVRTHLLTAHRLWQLVLENPVWFAQESLARVRHMAAPKSGARTLRIGEVSLELDLDLDPIVRQMYARSYEIAVVKLVSRLLSKGDTFVDVGANIGYISAVAASCVGVTGEVFSFEPVPEVFRHLDRNRALNPRHQWSTSAIAVGAEKSRALIATSNRNVGFNSLVPDFVPEERCGGKVEVPVETLDDLFARTTTPIRLLKIDTEGYEGPVIQGARRLLQSNQIRNLIVEINRDAWDRVGVPFDEVMRELASWGYSAHDSRHPYRPIDLQKLYWAPDVWFRLR